MNELRFSVIIPTCNRAAFLAQALESALEQSYPAAQIIVIDDGSSDNTRQILRKFERQVQVIRQPSRGIGAARNRGMDAAEGDYLAFLDDDDLWQPNKLERQAAFLRQHPKTDLLYADAREFDSRGTVHESYCDLFPGVRQPSNLFEKIIRFQVPLTSTVCVRSAFLREHRLAFIEAASGVDELGLFMEMAARGGRFAFLDEVVVSRRLHEKNISKKHYNRFEKRCVLYARLQERLPNLSPANRQALDRGLRHAHFKTGECYWGEGDRRAALDHFRQARGWDGLGAQAAFYAAACRLPDRLAGRLRALKRLTIDAMR